MNDPFDSEEDDAITQYARRPESMSWPEEARLGEPRVERGSDGHAHEVFSHQKTLWKWIGGAGVAFGLLSLVVLAAGSYAAYHYKPKALVESGVYVFTTKVTSSTFDSLKNKTLDIHIGIPQKNLCKVKHALKNDGISLYGGESSGYFSCKASVDLTRPIQPILHVYGKDDGDTKTDGDPMFSIDTRLKKVTISDKTHPTLGNFRVEGTLVGDGVSVFSLQ